ncbi:MAG: DEAD/DEAH box helicase [Leptolyngbyaceae cyanobacterium bins.302]|nr:DEAD/DEAH box helicase [Leptolyngbyaceae cyanobacterium bins.302]
MATPNYNTLLQSFWNPTVPSSTVADNTESLNPKALPDDIAQFLGEQLLWQETIPAQVGELYPIPKSLPSALTQALTAQGFSHLYSHQFKALKAIRAGNDVILTPPTAAGKTLAAYIGILEGCLHQGYRCLSFYGLKALASDQNNKLSSLLKAMPQSERLVFAKLTGDTSKEDREILLAAHPHVIALTPELLHYQLRTTWRLEGWQSFFRHLRYVLVDECHTYRGVFGANMALLLKRLKLMVARYGGDAEALQFIFLSATCGNPTQLAQMLSGRKRRDSPKRLVWLKQSGAATAAKRLLVTQPSHHTSADVARIMLHLMQQGLRGITFCNSRHAVKSVAELVTKEANLQNRANLASRVAVFYGSLDDQRRSQIMRQLEAGEIAWIVGTEALEAGIDLLVVDCAILRGFPGSLTDFWQRVGRAGRKRQGLAIYVPVAQNLLDSYFTDRDRLFGTIESIHFNPNYPILLAKHLLCAASEGSLSLTEIQRSFGKAALPVAKVLIEQGHLHNSRKGFYAKGFPQGDINFRGGVGMGTIKLVDQATGKVLECTSDEIAYREVFPGAIYRRQDDDGQLVTYRSLSLDTTQRVATLQRTAADDLLTSAITRIDAQCDQPLTPPKQVVVQPLTVWEIAGSPSTIQVELSTFSPELKECQFLTLELGFGSFRQVVEGYQRFMRLYQRTCLNRKCSHYRTPLPNTTTCLLCGKPTREAELLTLLDEERFPSPYVTQHHTPILSVSLSDGLISSLQQVAGTAKALLGAQEPVLRDYQVLWNYPAEYIALHSLGHQLMTALPMVVRTDAHDLEFVVQPDGNGSCGLFFDTADGGNGATEAVFNHFTQLCQTAASLAGQCDCETGCPRCLVQHGCPDRNQGLLKQMGLILLEAIAPSSYSTAPSLS